MTRDRDVPIVFNPMTGQGELAPDDGFYPQSTPDIYVSSFGAKGDGVTDDTVAILAGMAAAAQRGLTLRFAPGTYLHSAPLLYQPGNTTSVLAPSLIGAPGRPGPSEDFARIGVVRLLASSTFPIGEFSIDYIGSTAAQTNISGYTVSGFVIDCNSRSAGTRSVNSENSTWSDLVVTGSPKTPAPANTVGSPTAAVNFYANPSYNATFNYCTNVYVTLAEKDGFAFLEDTGSYVVATNCMVFTAGRYCFEVGPLTTLVSCGAQQGANTTVGGADWHIRGTGIVMVGCQSFNATPNKGNGISFAFLDNCDIVAIGCFFRGPSFAGLSEANGAIVQIPQNGNISILFEACHFRTGSQTTDFVYVANAAHGNVSFNNCSFNQIANALLTTKFRVGTSDLLKFTNCNGLNPFGAVTVALTSGVYYNNNPIPLDVYVNTAGSYTGTTTITPLGGSAATVPNAIAGGLYRLAPYATLTVGVAGTITTPPTFYGYGN